MDLGLSEIQQMLKNSAREFLTQECPLTLVREMEEDPRGYTDNLWRQLHPGQLSRYRSSRTGRRQQDQQRRCFNDSERVIAFHRR